VSRVLVTGGAGALGAAVVRHLLGDPRFEVRVSDLRPIPHWMREGAEVHAGDLREPEEARKAVAGCQHLIHLAATGPGDAGAFTVIEGTAARSVAVIRAALEETVERFVYVSSGAAFEDPLTGSPDGFAHLTGERLVRAAGAEHGLAFTICRAWDAYGPAESPDRSEPGGVGRLVLEWIEQALDGGAKLELPEGTHEQTVTPTYVDDAAEGIVTAMASPAGLNEDFDLAGEEELTVAELARAVWKTCGRKPAGRARAAAATQRPSVEQARELLGWTARIGTSEGVARTVAGRRAALKTIHSSLP